MMAPYAQRSWLWVSGLLLLGSLGCAAAWILLGTHFGRLLTPMAVLAALDAALLLHLARVRRGLLRAMLAVLVTATCTLLAIGSLIGTRVGLQLGLSPWESIQRLGLEPAWLIAKLSLDQVDLTWLLAGVLVALLVSR